MKIFLSADIEGVTGTTHWDETEKGKADYDEFREQMTAEVAAACRGAIEAGATEIWVKDAHDSARNLIASRLPQAVKLVRGWSGHPYLMMDSLDATFAAVMMLGYHSPAGSPASPLSHTMTGSTVSVKINDRFASEFLINAYTSGLVKVPVVFVTGDIGLCDEARTLIPAIRSVAVKQGIGNATINIHPQLAVDEIRKGAYQALKGDPAQCQVPVPKKFQVEIQYKDHAKAYGSSFFPGARLKDATTIQYDSEDYFAVLTFLGFVL